MELDTIPRIVQFKGAYYVVYEGEAVHTMWSNPTAASFANSNGIMRRS